MKPEEVLSILGIAEKLKCITRHSDTSSGRRESVAEHSWRLSLFAMLMADEFPEADINKVIKMCLIHDLGEAFTGDIATFCKTEADCEKEKRLFIGWIESLPDTASREFISLYDEMEKCETEEAKLYKALDKLEAVIQHNESDIKTWLPLEYDLQLTYGSAETEFSDYLKRFKSHIDDWTKNKIATQGK